MKPRVLLAIPMEIVRQGVVTLCGSFSLFKNLDFVERFLRIAVSLFSFSCSDVAATHRSTSCALLLGLLNFALPARVATRLPVACGTSGRPTC